MLRRAAVVLSLGLSISVLGSASGCGKPTIVEDPEPAPQPTSDRVEDPLVEQAAVRDAVRRYTEALQTRDVAAAGDCVVPETFTLYEDLRIAALRSTREQLESLGLLSVLMVLQIRSTVGRAELESIDGRRLFEFAVAGGLVGAGLDGIDLDDVRISETRAEIWFEGGPIVWLRETEGGWQIDIPRMVELLDPEIEASAREQVVADGRLRTAYALLTISSTASVDLAVLDGPLEL